MNELYERIENMARRRGLNITQLCIQSGASRGSLGDLKTGRIDIPKSWLRGRSREEFIVFRVSGQSMFPTYQEGDLVLALGPIRL